MSEYTVLPTNLVDDELAPSNERRRYRMIDNGDGTYSFEEVTTYTRVGSNYGASQINAQNEVINQLKSDLSELEGKVNNVNILDVANTVALDSSSASTVDYTTTKNGALICRTKSNTSTAGILTADNKEIAMFVSSSETAEEVIIYGIPSGTRIQSSVAIAPHSTGSAPRFINFIPYKEIN